MLQRMLLALALLASGVSQAAGLTIDPQDARATGMGKAVVSNQKDAAALFYNPAGIADMEESLQVKAGVTGIMPRVDFTSETGAEYTQDFTLLPPPHVYAAWAPAESFALGLGLATPWGNSITWPEDFIGRVLAQHSRLVVYELLPSAAYAPVSWLRVGAGVRVARGTVRLERRAFPTEDPGLVVLEGDAWGLGFQAGAQADLVEGMLSLGVNWRSGVDLDFQGTTSSRDIPPMMQPLFPEVPFSSEIRLPASVVFGATVRPIKQLSLAVDVGWIGWSSVEEILIDLEPEAAPDTRLEKRWQDRWLVRVGAEYGVTERLALRAGFNYDPTPSPAETLTPELPDADRLVFTVGGGYGWEHLRLDAAYELLLLQDKRSTFQGLPGTYGGTAHLIVLTLGWGM